MKTLASCTLAAVVFCGVSAYGADNLNFRGTLLESPPCEINGNQPVEIDFREVGVNRIDGVNYARTFTLSYDCEGARTDMILRYLGNVTVFDPSAVQSNIPDFGIRLAYQTQKGEVTPLAVGSSLQIASDVRISTFVATPVKKARAELQAGAFTAGATLQLNYP